VLAGYVRWDQNLNTKLVATLGVRAEHTKIDYKGHSVLFDDEGDFDGTTPAKFDNDYLNILPSVLMKYDATDNIVLRAAYTTTLARPNYYDLVPFANINVEDNEILAGNPLLEPTISNNFDLMGEYYFKSVGLVSVGGFYKNLKNFIYASADDSYTAAKFANDFPGMANPIEGDDEWDFLRPMNGRSVSVYGFEVAIQRRLDFFHSPLLRNLGVYLNYTYTDSKAKGIFNEDGDERKNIGLPGMAPHMFNASLSWENSRFAARVSLNYSGSYLDEVGGDEFEDRWYDSQLFVDANASCRIGSHTRIFAEANNLTNQPLRYYQSGVKGRTAQMEYYKPAYTLGLKLEF
jgi:TonB-dependent receptor